MKEKLNTSLHSVSLIMVAAGLAWVVWSNDTSMREMLTYLLLLLVVIEILSLILIRKIYPESHTSFKVGIIAAMIVLLGVNSMFPGFFIPLTLLLMSINYLYNFYTDTKRRSGTLRKKPVIKPKSR